MLQTIRDKLTGWVALAFVAIIGLSLALTFGSNPTVVGRDYAARVNGEEIPVTEFREIYRQQLAQQQERLGFELPEFLLEQLQREVVEGLVTNRIVRQYAQDTGLRVSDQRVAEEIRSLPGLQVGGQFSPQSYIALLANQGISPTRFEDEQRQVMTVRQLQIALLESSFFTPAEFRRYVVLEGERRRVSWVAIDPRELQAGIEVSEAEIEAFYTANPERFTNPESVRLQYVTISLDEIAAGVEIDEEDLRAAWESERRRFSSEEERRARHILIVVGREADEESARERAEALHARLAAGEDFATLAREYSDDPGSAAQGGDLGFAGRGVFDGPFEDALFALAEGETSAPVRTEFGYHLIRLEAVRAETGLSLAEAREELLLDLQRRAAEDTFFVLAEQVDDLALEYRDTLEPVITRTGLEAREIDFYTRSGGAPLGFSPQLVNAVFSAAVLEDGENTPLVELADGTAVVARVLEHRPPELRPLAEVRVEIAGELRLIRAAQAAANRGERLLERAGSGESLADLAAELGGHYREPVRLARFEQAVPPDLLEAVFRSPRPPGDDQPVFRGLMLPDGSYVVFRLDEVLPGRAEDQPRELRDERKELLARGTGSQELEALVAALRGKAKVVIRQELFEPEANF